MTNSYTYQEIKRTLKQIEAEVNQTRFERQGIKNQVMGSQEKIEALARNKAELSALRDEK